MADYAERRAWRILFTGFFIFLILCGSTGYGIQWYLFQSHVTMTIKLVVARGTVGVILPNTEEPIAVTDQRNDLEPGVIIQTDPNSQALLTFIDPRSQAVVASLVIFRDSEVSLKQAQAARFGLNKDPYYIQVASRTGHSEVLIVDTGERALNLEFSSPQATAYITQEGLYIFHVTDQGARITSRNGKARVLNLKTQKIVILDREELVIVNGSNSNNQDGILELEAERSLLQNPYFSIDYRIGWNFYNDREPPGKAENIVADGRTAVVLDRSQSNWPDLRLGHGETGLVQFLNLDVSPYSLLEVRATFYVDEQSLSTCGIAASECPMMVRMVYLDRQRTERVFVQGFYATHDPGLAYPLQCDTCRSPHERINLQSWFTYESGNLMTLFPEDQRPAEILQISFYASGHAYRVYVSEVNLLGAE